MEQVPNNLPEMRKSDEVESEVLKDTPATASEKSRGIWIIILSLLLLVCFGFIIWLLFSGRADLKIQDNMKHSSEESSKEVDEGVVVNDQEINLTDYDSNITITSSGEHILSGILNYSVIIKSDGPVSLVLNGVTISSSDTSAILNKNDNPLEIILSENTTNALSDGGNGKYNGVIFSEGALSISALGTEKELGSLIISGHMESGRGIATADADLAIKSGKIMITSNEDGLNAGGENGGKISIESGVLWIRAGADGIDSGKTIEINGGNLLIMGGISSLSGSEGTFINGGNVVALGKTSPVEPDISSSQKFLFSNLIKPIKSGSIVYIKNKDTNKMVNFKTETDFETLIYSSPSCEPGNYEVIVDDFVVGDGVVK